MWKHCSHNTQTISTCTVFLYTFVIIVSLRWCCPFFTFRCFFFVWVPYDTKAAITSLKYTNNAEHSHSLQCQFRIRWKVFARFKSRYALFTFWIFFSSLIYNWIFLFSHSPGSVKHLKANDFSIESQKYFFFGYKSECIRASGFKSIEFLEEYFWIRNQYWDVNENVSKVL